MFRLKFDIKLFESEEKSAEVARKILEVIREAANKLENDHMGVTRYRLSRDEDRTEKNYLIKNENGHIARAKSALFPDKFQID